MKINRPILLTSEVVRALVQKGSPGVYLMGTRNQKSNMFEVRYVGRSDTCLQRRLSNHNHVYECDYFTHVLCSNPTEAFFKECYLWHALEDAPQLLNRIHPDSPKGTGAECPFCSTAKYFLEFVETRELKLKK